MAKRTRHDPYYDRRWRSARLAFLARNPLCAYCAAKGKITAASVVDHIIPHRGDYGRFWDADNWQALCTPCHASVKQAEEYAAKQVHYDAEGWPFNIKPYNSIT